MLSSSHCIASTESRRVASVHLGLAGGHMTVALTEAKAEDLGVSDILRDRVVGVATRFPLGVVRAEVHIPQQNNRVERIV